MVALESMACALLADHTIDCFGERMKGASKNWRRYVEDMNGWINAPAYEPWPPEESDAP